MEQTLEELERRFNALCDEQEELYRPAFEGVYIELSKIDGGKWGAFVNGTTNVADDLPTPNVTQFKEALRAAGHDNDEFSEAFIKYNELFSEGKKLQKEGLTMSILELADKVKEPPKLNDNGWNWYAYPISIVATKSFQPTIEKILDEDAAKGKGIYTNLVETKKENEELDALFGCDGFNAKSSLQAYWRELEEYGVTNAIGDKLAPDILRFLKDVVDYIAANPTSPNKVRNYISKIIEGLKDAPHFGLIFQVLIMQGVRFWGDDVAKKIGEGGNGYGDLICLLEWVEEKFAEMVMDVSCYQWGDNDKKRLQPIGDYLYTDELARFVQDYLKKRYYNDSEDEDTENDITLQTINNTHEELKAFTKAIEAGYMAREGDKCKWVGTWAQLGYFCYKLYNHPRPISKIKKYFGDIAGNINSAISTADVEPRYGKTKRWRSEIDKILEGINPV